MSGSVVLEPVVEGYFHRLSYEPGEEVSLHCSATVPHPSGRVEPAIEGLTFDLEIARLGAHRAVIHRQLGLWAKPHAIASDASTVGVDWPSSVSFVAGEWSSGWYEALFTATRPDGSVVQRRAGFVLRAPTGRPTSAIVLVLSLNTWNAYNDWGGTNLYLGATAVSFRRPFAHGLLARPDAGAHRNANVAAEPDLGGTAWAAYSRANRITTWAACAGWPTWEGPFIAWAESNGYNFDYAVNADLEERPELLESYRMLLSVGHDEYWSSPMRDTVEGFIAGGGNVAFFSGNTSFWQVRLEDDGHTMVSFKDRARRHDPLRHSHPELLTGMWSDPIINRPESQMTGVSFSRGGYARLAGATPRGQRGYTIWRPDHWMFANTGLAYGDLLGAEHCVVGYECDGCELIMEHNLPVPTGADGCPPGFEILGSAPARLFSVNPEAGVNEYPTGLAAIRTTGELEGVAHVLFGDSSPANVQRVAHGNAVLGSYTAHVHGGIVITSGCTDWAYGVAGGDPLITQITRTILDTMSAPSMAKADGA